MSTRKSLSHSKKHHLYVECFDEEAIPHLQISPKTFDAMSNEMGSVVTVEIPPDVVPELIRGLLEWVKQYGHAEN